MGLFDGVKESFDSPQPGTKASERETPIDRWFGWSTESEGERKKGAEKAGVYGGECVSLVALCSIIWILMCIS